MKLNIGDKIMIVSPSGVIDKIYIENAAKVLQSWGYQVEIGRNAGQIYGRFAGTPEQRIEDLQEAVNREDIRAILCSRGGYGLSQIVDQLDFSKMISRPKWLIGFSDITILHNILHHQNIPSLHAIMAKHISELSLEDASLSQLKKIIEGQLPDYEIISQPENRIGKTKATLVGGNLSVLMGLRGSRFDLNYSGKILFIEDIGEKPYHIDRMMQNLRYSGVLAQLSGLVVGHFTDCPEDPLMLKSVRQIIFDSVAAYDFPVCFGFPSGHEDVNLPLILNSEVVLDVQKDKVNLTFV